MLCTCAIPTSKLSVVLLLFGDKGGLRGRALKRAHDAAHVALTLLLAPKSRLCCCPLLCWSQSPSQQQHNQIHRRRHQHGTVPATTTAATAANRQHRRRRQRHQHRRPTAGPPPPPPCAGRDGWHGSGAGRRLGSGASVRAARPRSTARPTCSCRWRCWASLYAGPRP